MLDGSEYFILHESKIPEGYRSVGDIVLKFIGSGHSKYVVCVNPFDCGVSTSPRVQVYTPDTLYLADRSKSSELTEDGSIPYITYTDNGEAQANGLLYAVILKRNVAEPETRKLTQLTFEGWNPVYGNNRMGYQEITGTNSTLEKAIQAIKSGQGYAFSLQAGDTMQNTYRITAMIENMPGSIERYYTFMLENGLMPDSKDSTYNAYIDPQYTVAYYYSTAHP